MKIEAHKIDGINIAEVTSTGLVITGPEDGLALLGDLYYQGFDKVILHQENITEEFFDLKTGIAGEILQKFSNYRVSLAIVGDFTRYASQSLRDFILESNKTKQVKFVSSTAEALSTPTNR